MSPIDPGLGDDYNERSGDARVPDDRGQPIAERVYRERRGYGDHGFVDIPSHRGRDSDGSGNRGWLALFAVVLIAVGAGAAYYFTRDHTPTIDIVDGDGPTEIAAKLFELDETTDQAEVIALLEGPGPGIIPGSYPIDDELQTVDQVRALQADWVAADPGITFPEGFTVQKIAARIAANRWQYTVDGLMAASEGLTVDPRMQRPPGVSSTEGLLFPSTYSIGSGLEASKTMGQMLVNMQTLVFDEMGIEEASQRSGLTPYQLITVASLVEKEAKTDGDRALISRVIHNRIQRDMELQIDASLYYQAAEDATFSELREADSDYNLYERKGLPPTPIANPGRASLEAAFNPAPPIDPGDPRCEGVAAEDCQLLFYVLKDEEGNHEFAVTYDQHQVNVEAAREAGVL